MTFCRCGGSVIGSIIIIIFGGCAREIMINRLTRVSGSRVLIVYNIHRSDGDLPSHQGVDAHLMDGVQP